MDNSFLKKIDYYWLCLIFTLTLSFGFYLTHSSMGVDDEIIEAFYTSYSIFHSDRIGRIIYKILQIWEYIPFWREFLAIFTLSIGITLHAHNFMKYINFDSFLFDKKMATIFSCLSISFPFLTFNLMFMLTCLENGINMILSAIAVYFFYKYQTIKEKKIYLLITFFSLLYIVSVYEYGIFYFLASCLFIELINLIFNEKYKANLFYKNILNTIIILIPCIFIIYLISFLLRIKTNIIYMRYEEWFRHDFSSFLNFVNSFISSTHELIKNFIETCSSNFGSKLSIMCLISLFLFVIITSIKRKQIHIFLCGFILMILPFSIFILTGKSEILYRTYSLLGFINAFSFILLYAYFKNNKFLSKTIILLSIIAVFYQTLELNKMFYTEYLKYENDKLFAYSIKHEISKLNEKPLLIVGLRENVKLKYKYYTEAPEINISIFNWDRYDDINKELFISRPYSFMNEHGFFVEQYSVQTNSEKDLERFIHNIKELTKNMTIFPKDGSIKDCGEFILIKIGPSSLEKEEEPS